MSPRLRPPAPVTAGAALLALGLIALAPESVLAHALDQTFELPVPLGLYLVGAGIAVGASFVVTAIATRSLPVTPGYRTMPLPETLTRPGSLVLAAVGLALWYGAIAVAFVVGDITPLPAVLFWIGIWVALPLIAVLLGNPWPSLSPFRATFGLFERLGRGLGMDRLDAGLAYPAGVRRWPAVLLLATGLWAELILPGSDDAARVGVLMLAYTLVTLAGMALFGRVAWLRNAELFEIALGWFGRVGPLGRRAIGPTVCEGCEAACDPTRCVDCPECLVAAEPGELQTELRPWVSGLTEVRGAGWSDAAFIVLLLAGVTYDGLQETALWTAAARAMLPPFSDLFGPGLPITLIGLTLLATTYGLFLVAFGLAVGLARGLSDPLRRRPLSRSVGVYAATLLPIAAGYLVAHYLTLVIQGAIWLPGLLADPMLTIAPRLTWIPTGFVWYLSVTSIVGGHVAAIVLAHRISLAEAPARPAIAGLPLVALMVGYTVLSLWIIAQPMVVDPVLSARIGP